MFTPLSTYAHHPGNWDTGTTMGGTGPGGDGGGDGGGGGDDGGCGGSGGGGGGDDCDDEKPPDPPCAGGEPIYLFDGSFYYLHTDLRISGRIPIIIRRAYDTRIAFNGMFGYGWSLNYHVRIFKTTDSNLLLKQGDNSTDTFTYNITEDKYFGPAGVYDTISLNVDGTYTLRKKYGLEYHFDMNGVLTKIEDTNGNQLLFTYDPAGKLPINGISQYSVTTNPIVIGYDYRLTRIDEARNDIPSGRYVDFTCLSRFPVQ